ncbi:putative PEP-binding protein [Streptomyces griseus]|uniref:putative PEP-binding protein n=1 Tax=Streptomyces griseus TaxID=1911 RepID=UPI0036C3FD43
MDPDEYTVFEPSMKDPALGPVIDVRTGTKRVKTVYAEAGLTRTVDTRTTSAPTGLDRFPRGGVLVTGVTDPDREPVMKRAAAIVTDHGSRTSHAAIVSRELGVPAVVGPGNGTRVLRDGGQVTVSCAYVMAEIPANIILAEDFARRFDGFSIGSNDLTQLTLGVDRDSEALAHVFDESDPAVVRSIRQPAAGRPRARREPPAGLCGRRPSDNPSFAAVLVDAGLDSVSVAPASFSVSVAPDSFATVKRHIARAEKTVRAAGHDRGE